MLDIFVGGFLLAEGDVVGHRIAEEEYLLRHVADRGAKCLQWNLLNAAAVDAHRPFRWVDQPRNHLDQRRLTRAGAADDGERGAGRYVERNALQYERSFFLVTIVDVLKGDTAGDLADLGDGLFGIGDVRLRVEDVVEADHRRRGTLDHRDDEAHRCDRPRHIRHVDHVLGDVADRNGALGHQLTTEPDDDHLGQPDEQQKDGTEARVDEGEVQVAALVGFALGFEGLRLGFLPRVGFQHADPRERLLYTARQL